MIMENKILRNHALSPGGASFTPYNELHYHELYLSIITGKMK